VGVKQSKDTGLTNFWLSDDIYFIHYSMLSAMFAPTQANGRHNSFIELQEDFERIFIDQKLDALVNTRFLSMEYDFKVYIYLLRELELNNSLIHKNKSNEFKFEFTIELMPLLKFLNKKYEKKFADQLFNSFSKLRQATLIYSTLKERTESGLISEFTTIGEGRKTKIKITFPKNILNVFGSKRQVRIDINEINKYCKNGGDTKLFLMLKAYNSIDGKEFNEFDYKFLQQALAHVEYHKDNGVNYKYYENSNSRSTIENYFKNLSDSNFIVPIEEGQEPDVYKLIKVDSLPDVVKPLSDSEKEYQRLVEEAFSKSQSIQADLSDDLDLDDLDDFD
jgi:hypothetical protein